MPVKVAMLLADYAQVADGKLNVIGGGWSIAGPGAPFAIALDVKVPWDQTNMQHTLRLELVDADGQPVMIETPDGEQPLVIEGQFEVGRPAGVKPGTPIDCAAAFNFAPGPPLAPGGRYEWRLSIDGETDEDWTLPFSTRPA